MPVKKGDIVIRFDCNGCMASDHQFRWIGKVVTFEPSRYSGQMAVVQIFKRDTWGDIRDRDEGVERVAIEDKSLQIVKNIWILFK